MKQYILTVTALCLLGVACHAFDITRPDPKSPLEMTCGSYGTACSATTCCPKDYVCATTDRNDYFNLWCSKPGTCCRDPNYDPAPPSFVSGEAPVIQQRAMPQVSQ
jgi:hypothetical protein